MKGSACLLVLLLGGMGCARIYRPVAMASSPLRTPGPWLSGHLERQPWGDNSRYEARAKKAHLQVLVLTLENTCAAEVEVLKVEAPSAVESLTPEAALKLVKQWPIAYASYVLVPAAAAEVAAAMSSSDFVLVYASLGLVGLLIAIPNAIVASFSNDRLGSFFRAEAWSPRVLHAGEARHGLLFLRTPEQSPPLSIRIHFRVGDGAYQLELSGP